MTFAPLLLALPLCAGEAEVPAITRVWTNRVEQVISVLTTESILEPCPICGQPNHHAQQTVLKTAVEQLRAQIVAKGTTTEVVLSTTRAASNWLATNFVPAGAHGAPLKTRSPGWAATNINPPPLP